MVGMILIVIDTQTCTHRVVMVPLKVGFPVLAPAQVINHSRFSSKAQQASAA
jgi:hypothetical protein